MDILGNPELLWMWCDPIRDLVITRSSEGSRSASSSLRESKEDQRQYEGEWIEAASSPLILPSNVNRLYSTSRSLATILGFPTYGRVTMFVERQRGQVALTIGPFPGNLEVCHKLTVQEVNQKIRIVDEVRVQSDSSSDNEGLCGLFSVVEKCILPAVDDYMDQVLSSAARLRFLIENKETPSLVDNIPTTTSVLVDGGDASAPLLRP